MKITKSITAENQWSTKFELLGDALASTKPARALICATSDASTVTLRRYASDGTTVIASLDLDSVSYGWQPFLTPRQTQIISNRLCGLYVMPEDEAEVHKRKLGANLTGVRE